MFANVNWTNSKNVLPQSLDHTAVPRCETTIEYQGNLCEYQRRICTFSKSNPGLCSRSLLDEVSLSEATFAQVAGNS